VKPAALALSPEAPYPRHGGGALRTASLLEFLAQHYTLDLILFRDAESPDPREALPEGLVRDALVIKLPFHSKEPVARWTRNLGRLLRRIPPHEDRFAGYDGSILEWLRGRHYALGVIEHFWAAGYMDLLRPHCDRLMLDLHNLESEYYLRRASIEPAMSLPFRVFAQANQVREARRLPLFDAVLVPSAEMAARIRHKQAIVYPNAVPECAAPERGGQDYAIAFTGNLEYPPNITAVGWFGHEVWPRLKKLAPTLEWRIIGKNPRAVEEQVQGLRSVNVVGPVEDAVAELARCQAAVAPIRSGSGTRLKILEAWAAGTPVISTRLGAEGLGARDGCELLLADTADEFVDQIQAILTDEGLRGRVGRSGREYYERAYSWPAAWRVLEKHLI
jgi:glycosyltransferase involved in cell wall biosynthesis